MEPGIEGKSHTNEAQRVPLGSNQLRDLSAALEGAFTLDGLRQLLRMHLPDGRNVALDSVVSVQNRNLHDICSDLVLWALRDKHLGLHGLLAAALAQGTQNPALLALQTEWNGVVFTAPKCPYPGLPPFTAKDHFYGRDAEIEQAVDDLRRRRFLLVIGDSGSGKSSLVAAGIMPALQNPASPYFADKPWLVCTMRPGPDPFAKLAAGLGLAAPAAAAGSASSAGGEGVLAGAAERLARYKVPEGRRLLLVVDQYEEMFTTAAAEQRAQFEQSLPQLLALPDCCVILVVRADFYPNLIYAKGLPDIGSHQLTVRPLRGEALKAAIAHPARDVGVELAPELVERLLADAGDEEPGVLPFIQETLRMLWAKSDCFAIGLDAYTSLVGEKSGRSGLQVALAKHAEDVYCRTLVGAERDLVCPILLRLIQFGEGRAHTRRQQTVEQLRQGAPSFESFDHVLSVLIDHRLLTSSRQKQESGYRASAATTEGGTLPALDAAERLVDLAHEALINGWPRLHEWVADGYQDELTRRRLEDKASERERLRQKDELAGLLDFVELAEAERWIKSADTANLGVSIKLAALVADSRAEIDRRVWEKEEAARRELAQAQALAAEAEARRAAEAERAVQAQRSEQTEARRAEEAAQSVRRLHKRNQLLGMAFAAVLIAMIVAVLFFFSAQREAQNARAAEMMAEANAAEANNQRATADANAAEAARQQAVAEANAAEASRQQAAAEVERAAALQAEATAEARRIEAEAAQVEADSERQAAEQSARSAQAENLAAQAQLLMQSERTFDDRALLLARDAVLTTWNSPEHYVTANADSALRAAVDGASWSGTVPVAADGLRTVAFSPNDALIAAAGDGELIYLVDADTLRPTAELRGHTGRINSVAFSPDGRLLASAGRDETVRVWDVQTGELLNMLAGHTDDVVSVAFDPAGTMLASGSVDGTLRLWQAADGTALRTLTGHSDSVESVVFSPDGALVASGSLDGKVQLWEPHSGRLLRTLEARYSDAFTSVAFSTDGSTIMSVGAGITIHVWDVQSGSLLRTFDGREEYPFGLKISPDGSIIATGGDKVRLYDARTGALFRTLEGHNAAMTALDVSSSGKTLVSAGTDGALHLWDLAKKVQASVLDGHAGVVASAVFSPDGETIVSAGFDGTVRLWDAHTGDALNVLRGHLGEVTFARFSPNGAAVVSSGLDTVRVWNWRTGEELVSNAGRIAWDRPSTMPGLVRSNNGSAAFGLDGSALVGRNNSSNEGISIWDVATGKTMLNLHPPKTNAAPIFTPDGTRIATAGEDGVVYLWDAQTGNLVRQFGQEGGAGISSFAISPDGDLLVSAGFRGPLSIWDLHSGALRTTAEPVDRIHSISFSPDGRTILGLQYNGEGGWLWDATTGQLLYTFDEQSSNSPVFSPDGKVLAIFGGVFTARYVQIIDAHTGTRLRPLQDDSIWSIGFCAISPDSRSIACEVNGGVILLWELETGVLLRAFVGHTGEVTYLDYSPDGRYLLSAGADGDIRLWVASVEALLDLAEQKIQRSVHRLTSEEMLELGIGQ